MKGFSRAKKPKVNETPLLDTLPADFWQYAAQISLFSIEEWARLALAGVEIPPSVDFCTIRCMGCNTQESMAYDEWLRAEGFHTRCYCKDCFAKRYTIVSCTDWIPHVRTAYPEVRAGRAHEFMCREPMRNTKSAVGRFVEAMVRCELTGNGYVYKAEQAADLERITRRTAELLREILPKVAPYGRKSLCRVIGMIAVGVCGLNL